MNIVLGIALSLLSLSTSVLAEEKLAVRWEPKVVRQGDAAVVLVSGVRNAARLEGSLGGKPLLFFRYENGYAALAGIDLEVKPSKVAWKVTAFNEAKPLRVSGTLTVEERKFHVQRLTLPKEMVELDEPTERQALAEAARLKALWEGGATERLWRGQFLLPLEAVSEGSGYGARRIINGLRRSPHAGTDYSADSGTPVRAANRGMVAMIDEMFFPGRLVILDHGLGLFTLYFHLELADVTAGERVEKGQQIGRVGATGRATGPHLHFGVQLRHARLDPETLLGLNLPD